MSDRLKFQGKCLQSSEGHLYMEQYYDTFPPLAREMLQKSTFNICAACVNYEVMKIISQKRFEQERLGYRNVDIRLTVDHYLTAISSIESAIRIEDEKNAA